MAVARKAVEALYILLMAAGAMLAIYGVHAAVEDYFDAAARYGARGWQVSGAHVLAVGVTGAVELAATAAFAFVYERRGTNLFAPVAYLWTYAALGAASALLLTWTTRRDGNMAFAIAGLILAALAIAVPGLLWNYRSSQKD
jgi:hypothetical protein